MKSTLDGWRPFEGALVWLQVYNPAAPTWEASLAERVALDLRCGEPRLMRLLSTKPEPDKPEVTRWFLHDAHRPGLDHAAWADSEFCVLTDAADAEAQPDLLSQIESEVSA